MAAVAGSVAGVVAGIAQQFHSESGHAVEIRQGPAGLLAKAILEGIPVDLYIAASATGPRTLHDAGLFEAHRIIAHNRMELVLRPGLKAGTDDPLILLADPRWRIGMSTPGADPSGDYASAFLDALACDLPDLAKCLRSRCISLYGGILPDPSQPVRSPALEALRESKADMLIAYGTTALRIAETLPGASYLPLPLAYAPRTDVCACTRKDASEDVTDFLAYLCGNVARRKLEEAGFLLASV